MVLDMRFADGTRLRVREPDRQAPASITPGLGTHRLQVRVEVEPLEVAAGCNLVQLDGELHAEHPTGPRWVGSFHPVPVPLRIRARDWPADLVVPVTDAQVLALEKDRNGHDLQLRLDLRASLPQSREHAIVEGQDTRRVPASTWEAQIQQLGRAVCPSPSSSLCRWTAARSPTPPATCARRISRSPGASTATPSARHAWPSRRCGT